MIIIETTNGVRMLNDQEVAQVRHNKQYASAIIMFKNGSVEYADRVQNVIYNNKENQEISDSSFMLTAALMDAEYYRELSQSAERYLEQMADYRSQLENMVQQMYEHPDDDKAYRERFVREMREVRAKRPDTIKKELDEHRDMPYYRHLRHESREKGDAVAKEFDRMTAEIANLRKMNDRYQSASERIMKRSLWQRIINKKTYL